MDRHLWTELDVKAARREWAVTTFNLDDPVVLPITCGSCRLESVTRRQHRVARASTRPMTRRAHGSFCA